MKKLSQILNENSLNLIEEAQENMPTPVEDRSATALSMLSQITEMIDDIYNTVSSLDEIDAETDVLIHSLYNQCDDVYGKLDGKYDIVPMDLEGDEYELGEDYNFDDIDSLTEALTVPDPLFKLGFRIAKAGNDTWLPSDRKVIALYGIPMRAGKWADTFFAVTDHEKYPYSIADSDGVKSYSDLSKAISAVKTMAKEGLELLDDTLNEVLSKDADASEWIADFIKSDAPQFKGKSKKERIKMALGAYYAAQKKEDLDEAAGFLFSFQNKYSGKVRKIKAKDEADAIKRMEKVHPPEEGHNAAEWYKKHYKIFKEPIREDIELDEDLEESVNLSKIKELVAMSLIDEKDVAATIAALKAAQSPEKTLTKNQISLLANLSVMLTNVILGDTAALSSVKRAAKE